MQGTVPGWCYAQGMTDYFYAHQLRIFDYPQWAQPLREAIRKNMERLAAENDIEIEFVRSKKGLRKEQRVKQILEKRGEEPGLVCLLSAMEPCGTYKPWHDKKTHRTYLKPDDGKCLHYYAYFIDKDLGLCYARVPTWCPFRLQVYCNGHSYLARHGVYSLTSFGTAYSGSCFASLPCLSRFTNSFISAKMQFQRAPAGATA